MPGQLIDVGQSGVRLPTPLVVDTNIVAARLLAPYYPPHPETAHRADQFFSLLRTQGAIGVLPAVACREFFHLAFRGLFRLALPDYRLALMAARPTKRRFNWEVLYKLRPDLIDQFLPTLEGLLPLLEINRLTVMQPWEVAASSMGLRYEHDLLRLVGRFRVNTNDAAILMQARQAGITSIATLDADLRRAAGDFDVYTWL
ncbi:MAG: hypothetical protein ACRDJW_12955 [Thermomicrobiales bacterium]